MEGVEGGVLEGHVERSTFGNAMNKKNETQIMHKRERGGGEEERERERSGCGQNQTKTNKQTKQKDTWKW